VWGNNGSLGRCAWRTSGGEPMLKGSPILQPWASRQSPAMPNVSEPRLDGKQDRMIHPTSDDGHGVVLRDGSTVVVGGGGPAGSFFAIRALEKGTGAGQGARRSHSREEAGTRPVSIVALSRCDGCSHCDAGISPALATGQPMTSPAIRTAASSSIAGIACEYTSKVSETVECPRRSDTTCHWRRHLQSPSPDQTRRPCVSIATCGWSNATAPLWVGATVSNRTTL
jgi:hypothetical protein